MKRLSILFLSAFQSWTPLIPAEESTEPAVKAAEVWLALVDSGKYEESWTDAAEVFKRNITSDSWKDSLKRVRGPLGDTKKREQMSVRLFKQLPGAPKGEYVVIQFKTQFSNRDSVVETLTPMKETNGRWKVSGYYIK